MITVNIKDGLGNQMFQYATGYATALRLNTEVACDSRSLNEKLVNPPPNYVKREFSLDIFGIYPSKLNFFEMLITFQFFKKYSYRFLLSKILDKISPFNFLERSRKTDKRILNSKSKIMYIDGYWQTENYFKDFREKIIQLFNFDELINDKMNIEFIKKINFNNDVCVNIRRTDHLLSDDLNVVTWNYYKKSIEYFLNKEKSRKFYIFSDDIKWCQKEFKDNKNFEIVNHSFAGTKFKNYLYLMSQFKNFIIPNSTFAWWGAWLSKKNKIVVAPKKWSGIVPEENIDTALNDWIRIDN